MTYAPKTLLDLDAYLRQHGVPTVGIVGDSAHRYGYHLGKDRLPAGDYSASLARDRAGLTNAASAIDIGNHTGLKAITNFLALAGAEGHAPDVREVIGPGFDGRAYRWSAEGGWNREGPRARGDSHEWHCHVSFYRDSEYRDKVGLFRPYIEGDDMALTDDDLKRLTAYLVPRIWLGSLADVVPAPEPPHANPDYATGNTKWQPGNALYELLMDVRRTRAELTGHETADAGRDAELLALVRQVESGERDAAEVVRIIGEKLTAASG